MRLRWTLTGLDRAGDGGEEGYYVATFDAPGGGGKRKVASRSVVTTIPAHAIGDALERRPSSHALATRWDASGYTTPPSRP